MSDHSRWWSVGGQAVVGAHDSCQRGSWHYFDCAEKKHHRVDYVYTGRHIGITVRNAHH